MWFVWGWLQSRSDCRYPSNRSRHDTTLPETSGEEAALIRATWEDRTVRPYLNSLDASARNVIVSAARSSKPVVNKAVLDYRYKNYRFVAETNEAVFVYDEARDKVTKWLVKASTLQRDSDWVELCDRVRRWPELNPLRHSAEINRLKLRVQVCYSVIAQLWDRRPWQTCLTSVNRDNGVSRDC